MLGISSQYKMLVGALVLSKPECLQECLDKHCWHVKKYKKRLTIKEKKKFLKIKEKKKFLKIKAKKKVLKSEKNVYIFFKLRTKNYE